MEVIKTIGTTGRDYSLVSTWEADLDNDTLYAPGDDAVGEMYNDTVFDELVTLNGGGTIGLNSIKLTAAESDRHTGVAGTGVEWTYSPGSSGRILTISSISNVTVEWIDFNGQDKIAYGIYISHAQSVIFRNNIVHEMSSHLKTAGILAIGDCDGGEINRNIIYGIDFTGTFSSVRSVGIDISNIFDASRSFKVQNNTVSNVTGSNILSAGSIYGIESINASGTNVSVYNNLVVSTSATTTGEVKDFKFYNTNLDSDYNFSSDNSAEDGGGVNNLIGQDSDQFVSATNFHLKTSSTAIDVGHSRGSSNGVNVDIDGDTVSGLWDIGADEVIVAGVSPLLRIFFIT